MRFLHPSQMLLFAVGTTFVGILASCENHTDAMNDQEYSNALIHESSPYLLQHAHNPVDWYPWGEQALDIAKKENRLILVSIGYSSCHWCHVMAHESFEDAEVAGFMNEHFVNIKVDREERPDIDQVYMTAVQLMTRQGGWPLNVVTLPDGRPIWGGTYFRKEQWVESLKAIDSVWQEDPEKVLEYAKKLEEGVRIAGLVDENDRSTVSLDSIHSWIRESSTRWDTLHGGPDRAPKFPMPVVLDLLFHYDHLYPSSPVRDHLELTLLSMARGGIYDQIGGGFARYSVDVYWKVPHFEKMLYDNAQLLSTYSMGYKVFGDQEMKKVLFQTREFLNREMRSPEGGYYSALDADSEGVEGKFYVWSIDDLKQILGVDYPLFADHYDVEGMGHWEGDHHILLRHGSISETAARNGLSSEDMADKVEHWENSLLTIRNKRPRPGTDTKILTSWNSLLVVGLLDAYSATQQPEFRKDGLDLMDLIIREFITDEGQVLHGRNMEESFLEDHATAIRALIKSFCITGNGQYLSLADTLAKKTLAIFGKKGQNLLFFRPTNEHSLFAESQEIQDNVIPAANSMMARNLFYLSRLTGNLEFEERSRAMLEVVNPRIGDYPEGYAQWLELALEMEDPFYEVAVVGEKASEIALKLRSMYLPQALIAESTTERTKASIFEGRWSEGRTRIFVCQNRACQLPVENVKEAIDLMLKSGSE